MGILLASNSGFPRGQGAAPAFNPDSSQHSLGEMLEASVQVEDSLCSGCFQRALHLSEAKGSCIMVPQEMLQHLEKKAAAIDLQ